MTSRAARTSSLVALLCAAPLAAQAPAEPAASRRGANSLIQMSQSLQALARSVSPAVVQIFVTGYGASAGRERAGVVTAQHGTGSGIIVDPDGYILTNGHVVAGARRIEIIRAAPPEDGVEFQSVLKPMGRPLAAKVVGVDRETDIAVLKVEGGKFPFLRFGDSEKLQQGEIVLAVGSPLGLENSVSLGVVSAVARQLRADDAMIYIQTDAPINPGNSGGPLVDIEGRVVGVNTLILSQGGGSEGLGFAAPSNIVRAVYDQLRKNGRVRRGQIGVEVQTINHMLAGGLALSRSWGVLVSDVTPSGAADAAGIEIGDVILTLNGKVMENARQFEVNLYQQHIGEAVTVELQRASGKLTKRVTVLESKNDPDRLAELSSGVAVPVPRLGILATALEGPILKLLPSLRKLSGVAVIARTSDPGSAGALRAGDVIYAVNNNAVRDLAGLDAVLDKYQSGDAVVLQVERDGKLVFVALEME